MNREYETFGDEWVVEMMKHDKAFIVEMLQKKGKENEHYQNEAKAATEEVATLTKQLDALERINDSSIQREAGFEVMEERDKAFRACHALRRRLWIRRKSFTDADHKAMDGSCGIPTESAADKAAVDKAEKCRCEIGWNIDNEPFISQCDVCADAPEAIRLLRAAFDRFGYLDPVTARDYPNPAVVWLSCWIPQVAKLLPPL